VGVSAHIADGVRRETAPSRTACGRGRRLRTEERGKTPKGAPGQDQGRGRMNRTRKEDESGKGEREGGGAK
jgi:hypothetical protein